MEANMAASCNLEDVLVATLKNLSLECSYKAPLTF